MTTQREPDTSAEDMGPEAASPTQPPVRMESTREMRRRWANIDVHAWMGMSQHALMDNMRMLISDIEFLLADRTLADAAGQAAPVPPPVEGLETTAEERTRLDKLIESGGELSPAVGARLLRDCWRLEADAQVSRDFMAVSDKRAEGLAKEVERLTKINKDVVESHNALLILNSRNEDRAEALKAKLAVYEAPIDAGAPPILLSNYEEELIDLASNEEAREGFLRRGSHLQLTFPRQCLNLIDRLWTKAKHLSAAHAECKGENTKLREALTAIDAMRYVNRGTVSPENAFAQFNMLNKQACEVYDIARAALAPASEEKAT